MQYPFKLLREYQILLTHIVFMVRVQYQRGLFRHLPYLQSTLREIEKGVHTLLRHREKIQIGKRVFQYQVPQQQPLLPSRLYVCDQIEHIFHFKRVLTFFQHLLKRFFF